MKKKEKKKLYQEKQRWYRRSRNDRKNDKELITNHGKPLTREATGSGLSLFYMWYMRLVWRTGRYELKNRELLDQDTLIGFWHGDSYCMQFVLRDIARDHEEVNVIVTSSERGEYIEQMIEYNGGKALRLPDGLEMRTMFSQVVDEAKKPGHILAVALDGPAGPHEEPKKLVFLLANKSGKRVLAVHFRFHRVWRVRLRWDNFKVPLPFGKITAEFQELGVIDNERLRNFDSWKEDIIKTI